MQEHAYYELKAYYKLDVRAQTGHFRNVPFSVLQFDRPLGKLSLMHNLHLPA